MKSRAKEYQWHIEWREPSELIPYEYNAKLHDDKQVKNIANSIKQKIRDVKDEIAHAGKYHKRDLTKYLHRLQKELFIIEREQQKSVAN